MLSARRIGSSVALATLVSFTSAPAASESAAPGPEISSVPLFASIALEEPSLEEYEAPLHMSGSVHTLIVTIHFQRDGTVSFAKPGVLQFTLPGVPQQYTQIFSDLGTPRTWPSTYRFRCLRAADASDASYELEGIPIDPNSHVLRMHIHIAGANEPILAQWTLRDGWTVSAKIFVGEFGNHWLPKEQIADITGHGYSIHTDITYGAYAMH